ncbi:hypothetical protein [Streptomyces sp. NPDC058247]|uniref:hypothetical protein n=1 Tax=Streptomyces sp. NPDC058247 TaxID=3346401 RepID=UPI0036EBFE62
MLGFGPPSSIVEFSFDTARTITNALYTGVFQRHPGLRLILAHCGGALPTLGWRIGEHAVMGRGPEDADIDPAHVAEVLRGLHYETALAGSRNLTGFDGFTEGELRGVERDNALRQFPRFA